jgi:hypothetical protein
MCEAEVKEHGRPSKDNLEMLLHMGNRRTNRLNVRRELSPDIGVRADRLIYRGDIQPNSEQERSDFVV